MCVRQAAAAAGPPRRRASKDSGGRPGSANRAGMQYWVRTESPRAPRRHDVLTYDTAKQGRCAWWVERVLGMGSVLKNWGRWDTKSTMI